MGGTVAVWMVVLVVCWRMFARYRAVTRCAYCGGEWSKHQEDCPYSGSGTRM